MPSTYTLNNGIELIATGEQSGTWGDTTNTNFELLDTSLDGQVTVTLASTGSSGSPNTLPVSDGAASNGRNRLIIFDDSSDLGGTAFVQLTPSDAEKIIYVRNSLSGSRSILLFQGTYSASNDYEVPAGTTAVVFFDGAGAGAVAANVFNNAHFDNLNVVGDVTIGDDLTLNSDGAVINFGADADVSLTHVADTGLRLNAAMALEFRDGDLSINSSADGQLDIDADTEVEIVAPTVDIDASTAMTIDTAAFTVTGAVDFNTSLNVDGTVTADSLTVDGTVTGNIASFLNDGNSTNAKGIKIQGGTDNGFGENYKIEFFDGDGTASGRISTNTGSINIEAAPVTINEGGSDYDFRVESNGQTHMLFVDAGNNAVNVGTSSANGGVLNVSKAGNVIQTWERSDKTSNTGYGSLNIETNSQFTLAYDSVGGLIIGSSTDPTTQAGFHNDLRFVASEIVVNEDGRDKNFRVESDTVSHMLFVDAGAEHVNIATSTDLGGVFNVDGQMSLSGVSGGTRRIALLNETSAYTGTFALQAGGGSSGYGGGIVMYGHSHATKPGDVSVGISANSSGSFNVNTHGTDTGTDVFIVKSDGDIQLYTNTLIQSNSSAGSVTIKGGATNGGGTIVLTGGNSTSDIVFKSQASTATPREVAKFAPTEAVFNETGEDIDFRVESDDNSNMFFVDSSSNKIGFRNGSPSYMLDATGSSDLPLGIRFTQTLLNESNSDTQRGVRIDHVRNESGGTMNASGSHIGFEYALTTGGASGATISGDVYGYSFFRGMGSGGNTSSNTYGFYADSATYGSSTGNSYMFYINNVKPSGGSGGAYGFYCADNNAVNVFNGQTIINEASAAGGDFRVESDTSTHAIFVDASENAIGLSRSDPAAGVSAQDAIIGWGGGGQILQTSDTVASGAYAELTVNSGGGGYTGQLFITNTVSANAAVRTHKMYFLAGRGTDYTVTQLGTDTGTSGGADFTITVPSNGLIRVTNDNGSSCQLVIVFIGTKTL